MTLAELNCLPGDEARQAFLDCCASWRWATRMASSRPYPSLVNLCEIASRVWNSLSPDDWLEAFASHPAIGQTDNRSSRSQISRSWSIQEQKGVQGAAQATLQELAELNLDYQRTFGYVFLVCATGKTADEMLQLLRQRLPNDRAAELKIAANEQRLITLIRLKKMLTGERDS